MRLGFTPVLASSQSVRTINASNQIAYIVFTRNKQQQQQLVVVLLMPLPPPPPPTNSTASKEVTIPIRSTLNLRTIYVVGVVYVYFRI
jgi:hypothetical protein